MFCSNTLESSWLCLGEMQAWLGTLQAQYGSRRPTQEPQEVTPAASHRARGKLLTSCSERTTRRPVLSADWETTRMLLTET